MISSFRVKCARVWDDKMLMIALLHLKIVCDCTHHESFANSYFCNFNLIDQFTIRRPAFTALFYKKVLHKIIKFYCPIFKWLFWLLGFLINDLITVSKLYWTRFVFLSPFALCSIAVAFVPKRRKKIMNKFSYGPGRCWLFQTSRLHYPKNIQI